MNNGRIVRFTGHPDCGPGGTQTAGDRSDHPEPCDAHSHRDPLPPAYGVTVTEVTVPVPSWASLWLVIEIPM